MSLCTGVSGQAWATYLPAEKAPADGSKPRGATIFARDFQTVVIYDSEGKFVGVRRPTSGLPIQVQQFLFITTALVTKKSVLIQYFLFVATALVTKKFVLTRKNHHSQNAVTGPQLSLH